MSDIKPLVVVLDDKFDGVYSGGKWTAWNLCYVPSKIFGDAKECADFFSKDTIVYGRGETPQEAIDDLKMILDCGISDPDEKDDNEEEEQMEPTSVWEFENIDDMWITQEGNEMSLLLKNEDNLTKIILTGYAIKKHNDEFATILKVDMEDDANTRFEQEQKIRELEKELGDWKKEAADCLKLRDEVRREKLMLKEENKQLKEEISRCNKVNEDLGSNAIELEKRMQMYKQSQTQKINELKKKLSLEKAANEAQHKFIREYAGKGTEVQFNYAIDEVKEVSYVIVDRKENERIKENLQSQHKMIVELNKANCENCADKEVVDNVNHPSHYTGKYECIDVMQDVFGDEATNDFCLCNAFKYIWRAHKKNGLEDVKKAVWYLNKYIEEAEKDGIPKGK